MVQTTGAAQDSFHLRHTESHIEDMEVGGGDRGGFLGLITLDSARFRPIPLTSADTELRTVEHLSPVWKR